MACRPRHADLFRATTAAFAARGRLQILSLEAGVRPIAMKWNLLAGGAVFHVKTAYDEGLSRYSPGAQLEVEAMSRFLSGGELWMDSCTDPGNALLHSLWKERRRIATLLAGRGLVGRTSVAVLPSMRRLRRWRRTRAAA
jgi:CelD/BcsL family acetyltransferase involved in cellulose biosynthesis